jgi:hypothetical protein
MSGYSYTTISIDPGQQPQIGVSIYPDEHAEVTYYPAREKGSRAFIGITQADVNVRISLPDHTRVTGTQLAFARALFHAAAALLAHCERRNPGPRVTGKADRSGTPLDQGAA